MGEIRQFSKVGEVVAVKGFRLNELNNLPLARILYLNVKRHIRGSIVEQPTNDSRLCISATREYMDSRLATKETHE